MSENKKIYAVKVGRKIGLFKTWHETQNQILGFPNAKYKSFTTMSEAISYLDKMNTNIMTKQSIVQKQTIQKNVTKVIVGYSDGGSRNTGNIKNGHVRQNDKAAWAYRLEISGCIISDTGGKWGATNNRMEIMALIKALEKLYRLGKNHSTITMVLDSKYTLDAITKGWIKVWKRRGWKRLGGELKNSDLWKRVDQLLPFFSKLTFKWTKGHADNVGNIFVDKLLNKTMDHMK